MEIGAHVVDRDCGTISVCLIYGHWAHAGNKSADHLTSAQAQTLRTLIADIRSRTQITLVTGHNTFDTCFESLSGLSRRGLDLDAPVTTALP